MKRFRHLLEAAGLNEFSALQALLAIISAAFIAAIVVELSFQVLALAIACFVAVFGLILEALAIRARVRSETLIKLWPEVLDSLHSAASSGMSLIDAISELAEKGPIRIRGDLAQLVQRIDSGESFSDSIRWLKQRFGHRQADQFLELIQIVHESGGAQYTSALRNQARLIRSDIALWGELESKAGWVIATAKLALIAPWIVVATLATRPENVSIYNSPDGLAILAFGLMASILAYQLITKLGSLTRPARIFS